ncbi:hypothetical protein D9756_008982 [Leucocoprinus leucothites]|uniref:Major facilitator superfamily (MFS) profile domain-containing protein n=1 Tax=Leucocoprinus leucothites TaxID=201217 RepID=A0A8H5CZW9_9AGAR|nr:hypothetical protein D9756_008982 [Leucoagaricus leucothites]
MTIGEDAHSEEDCLLLQEHTKRTRLPFGQLAILLYLRFCESTATYSLFPFINEFLTLLAGGDGKKVAYYASTMEVTRQAMSFITVLYWSRVSDYIGRKPIIILGTAALAFSSLFTGLSTTFWALVASRCLFTALNNNSGAIKSAIGEMTDATNRADAFALLHAPWAMGSSIGPLIGGYFAGPNARFPTLFGGKLWKEFPYLLPCVASFTITFPGLLAVITSFRETLSRSSNTPTQDNHPVAIRSILTRRVTLTICNYVGLVSCHMAYTSLQPLFLAMPISIGGLGFQPLQIGYILSIYGFVDSLLQTFLLAPIIRRFGLGNVFKGAVFAFVPIFLLFPLMNIYARDWFIYADPRSQVIMWALLILQLALLPVAEFGYGCMYIYITTSAPNNRSLGSINGLSQTAVALSRLIGPAVATSLLGLSLEKSWLNGYAVGSQHNKMLCTGILRECVRRANQKWLNLDMWKAAHTRPPQIRVCSASDSSVLDHVLGESHLLPSLA